MAEENFLIQDCRITYNPPRLGFGTSRGLDKLDGDSVVARMLLLRGFTPETGRIENCSFREEPSLRPGTMVIEPYPGTGDRARDELERIE